MVGSLCLFKFPCAEPKIPRIKPPFPRRALLDRFLRHFCRLGEIPLGAIPFGLKFIGFNPIGISGSHLLYLLACFLYVSFSNEHVGQVRLRLWKKGGERNRSAIC